MVDKVLIISVSVSSGYFFFPNVKFALSPITKLLPDVQITIDFCCGLTLVGSLSPKQLLADSPAVR